MIFDHCMDVCVLNKIEPLACVLLAAKEIAPFANLPIILHHIQSCNT